MNFSYYYQLRQVYYTVLSAIIYDGSHLDIYDYMAEDSANPYIRPYVIIGDMFSQDREDKCDRTENCTVTLQVVTAFKGQGGRTIADTITDYILNNKPAFDIGYDGIEVFGMKKISDTTLFEQNSSGKIFRRVLIFSHIINQA